MPFALLVICAMDFDALQLVSWFGSVFGNICLCVVVFGDFLVGGCGFPPWFRWYLCYSVALVSLLWFRVSVNGFISGFSVSLLLG